MRVRAWSASRRLWPLDRVDWAVAIALILLTDAETVIRYGAVSRSGTVTVLASIALLGMAWWRRAPLLAMASLAAHGLISLAAGGAQADAPIFAVFLVSYSLGANAGWRQLLAGAVIPPAVSIIIDSVRPGPYPLLDSVAYFAIFEVGAPAVVGRLVRIRGHLVARLREQTAELQLEREEAATSARASERLELSRRLNGLVVNGVEEIVTEASVAETSGDGQTAAGRIEAQGRVLLEQMRSLLQELGPAPSDIEVAPLAMSARTPRQRLPLQLLRVPVTIVNMPLELALSGAFFLALELELAVRGMFAGDELLSILGGLALAGPIAWSRRRPVAAAAASLAVGTGFSRLVLPLEALLVPVALFLILPFCVAAFSRRTWALIGLGVCALGLSLAFGVEDVVMNGGLVSIGFWVAGLYVRDRAQLIAALGEMNRQLAEERDARASRATIQERARVARELHDVVGHTLTVVVLQAGAARRLWTTDRGRAVDALRTVAMIGRGGLSELVRSLRELDSADAVRPVLADVRAVVEMARAAGLRVDFEPGSPPPALVGPELATAVCRIVQEALTNTLKHAPGGQASVSIYCNANAIDIEVVNNVVAGTMPSQHQSQGLNNMSARAAELGGTLDWGADGGVFRVRAQLPLQA